GYTNPIFRMLEHLRCPKKGLVGPWAHKYPNFAMPGPRIGFLQECLRWWDHWLKGIDTGIMDEPMFRAWMGDPAPPQNYCEESSGRWIAEPGWAGAGAGWPGAGPAAEQRPLLPHGLGEPGDPPAQGKLVLHPLQTVGLAAGRWCPYGVTGDQPMDQRFEEGGQLVFDSEPLERDVEIFGFPCLALQVVADRPDALIAATLCEILPDGSVRRVTYGVLNLSHRNSHEKLEPLQPGVPVDVRLQLNGIAHRFGRGNRMRVALSTSYWPIVWPSPRPVTLELRLGASSLSLPVRQRSAADDHLAAFPPAEHAPPLEADMIEPELHAWTTCHDAYTGITTVRRVENEGVRRHAGHRLVTGGSRESNYSIKPNDPLSARADIASKRQYSREGWSVSSTTQIVMTSTETHFAVQATLNAYEKDELVFNRKWSMEIPRDHV
ncbi:MAG: CocE/NonD family hydrolase, partial [Aestuariivirgaceae bacterium]